MVYENAAAIIGGTPLVRFRNFAAAMETDAALIGKLEFLNPAGSVKDRVGLALIDAAETQGLLSANSVIIEPTSGNTGVGLASVCAARGYRLILTMPETMSAERRMLLAAYGAELVLTEGAKGMAGAIAKAHELAAELPNAYIPGQFVNQANPAAHYAATGPEIWHGMDGALDAFVAGVGTGGTISGTGCFLKEQNPAIRVIAVEPSDSPVLSGGAAGPHKIQGIGAGFVPETLNRSVYDEVAAVSYDDAVTACRLLARTEGILVGISSGAALAAAAALGRRAAYAGKTIVVLLPDNGERYLSTGLFA